MKGSGSKVSPIEMAVLGIVWKREPCTAYSIMLGLSASASDFVRSKAGTVYPLVKRLVRDGFLVYEGEERGSKGERRLRVSPAGLEAVKGWVLEPVPPQEVAHTVDLVRMRAAVLGMIEPAARRTYIDSSLAGLQVHLRRCQEREREYLAVGDEFGALGMREFLSETRARMAWLEAERETILSLPAGKPGSAS
jgi:DNA-binding PadR family transcriptional regulator